MADPWAQFQYDPASQSSYAGRAPSAGQAVYAAQAAQGRDPNAPEGSANNPTYATPEAPSSPDQYYVDQAGQLHTPPGADDGWHGFKTDPDSAPLKPWQDWGASAWSGIREGAATVAALPGEALNAWGNGVENAAAWALGKAGLISDPKAFRAALGADGGDDFAHMNNLADTNDTNRAMQHVTGAYHVPQTELGRYADTIGQFAGNAIGPGGLPTRVARVVLPAVASEFAGETAHNAGASPLWENVARWGGAFLGHGAVQGGASIANAPNQLAGRAISAASDDQLANAVALYDRGRAAGGVPITMGEALAQSGGGNGLARLQHFWENSSITQPDAAAFFEQRPAAVKAAVTNFADLTAPKSPDPFTLGGQVQQGAKNVIGKAEGVVTRAAKPFYDALPGQEMDPDAYEAMAANPSYQKALSTLRGDPELNQPILQLPDHDLSVVNEVQKQLDRMSQEAAAQPGGMYKALLRSEQSGLTGEMARDASEPYGGQYGQARDTWSSLTHAMVDPIKAGPVGRMAQSPDILAQTTAAFPTSPPEGAAGPTGLAMQLMAGEDPDLASALARQHVMNTYNGAVDNAGRSPGPQQFAGARFAHDIAGHPEGADVLDTNFRALPDGEAKADDLADLIENLRATGQRFPRGSDTAWNKQLEESFRTPGIFTRALSTITDPLEIGRHINNAVGGALYGSRVSGLGDILLPGDDAAAALAKARAAAPPDWLPHFLLTAQSH